MSIKEGCHQSEISRTKQEKLDAQYRVRTMSGEKEDVLKIKANAPNFAQFQKQGHLIDPGSLPSEDMLPSNFCYSKKE